MSVASHRCFKALLPGSFLSLVPFFGCSIERMSGDLHKVTTGLDAGVTGNEQGVNAII
jgi:hypothetical protein